jgi:hypothetical protein
VIASFLFVSMLSSPYEAMALILLRFFAKSARSSRRWRNRLAGDIVNARFDDQFHRSSLGGSGDYRLVVF